MIKQPLKQLETRVTRTYRGGKLLDSYLSKEKCEDTFLPEDWITSFVAAQNREYIENEGITKVLYNGETHLITELVGTSELGEGRTETGVLLKYLDSGERLGIQVHPTDEFAHQLFGSRYGKTESWHILDTRDNAVIYLGFKEWVTKEYWKSLYEKQDIMGMLDALHSFPVNKGDTILVKGGMPHAIGAGCFLLEVQQPSDYTMRVEKVTLAGEVLTPKQLHYGAGEENLINCFDYTSYTAEQIQKKFFLKHNCVEGDGYILIPLITYSDTELFKLERVIAKKYTLCEKSFVTVLCEKTGGYMVFQGKKYPLNRADKYFVPANTSIVFEDASVLICYPPRL